MEKHYRVDTHKWEKRFYVGAIIFALIIAFMMGRADAFSVTLAWEASPSPDVSEYVIHWGTKPGFYDDSASVGNELKGQVTNLLDGTMYYFAVSCRDIEGQESGYSNEVFTDGVHIVPDGNPPLAPGGCYIVAISP